MNYPIIEVEVTQPLPTISLGENDTGVAVLVRRKGKPVAFWMEPQPPSAVLSPTTLSQRISQRAGTKLLSEAIREGLVLPVTQTSLPSLTIAVCTRNRVCQLQRCLHSLQTLPLSSSGSLNSLEILVVDNAPSDTQTRDLVASLPQVLHIEIRYICEPRAGLDFARNRAIREATGQLLAFLDDDVTVDRGWLFGLLEAWTENEDAAAFTGLVLPYELATEAQLIFERGGGFGRGFNKIRFGQSLPSNPLYPCGAGMFGAGANMAFRRDVLVELGEFDEVLDTGSRLPGGGDLDIFYRVVRAGYPLVYEPRYLVFHQHRREMKALRRQYWSWGLGFMAFVVKSYRTDPDQRSRLRRLVHWWFMYQLRQMQRSICRRHPLPPRMILAEIWGGVRGLLGEYDRSQRRINDVRRRFEAGLESS